VSRYDLTGKVALVTGEARGIGFATSRALIARGASVAIIDGRLSATKRLSTGRYTLNIIATNACGQRSAPASLSFTIVKLNRGYRYSRLVNSKEERWL